ncbi:hypothetical protein ACWGMA_07800 [Streptomyces asiaticus]
MTEPTLFDAVPTTDPIPPPDQRVAFTGEGRHWHGTVTRTLTGHDGKPRVRIDVDPGNHGISSVVYRLGSHFRLTREGETCPDCGKPDRGQAQYGCFV